MSELGDLTDDELRAALAPFEDFRSIPINSSTRQLLLRKIAEVSRQPSTDPAGESHITHDPIHPQESPLNTSDLNPSSSENGSYYVLAIDTIASNLTECEHVLQHVYTSMEDAERAIKKHIPGACFKKFDTEQSAISFIEQQQDRLEQGNSGISKSSVSQAMPVSEKANNYPSLKMEQLNKFRKLIEDGNLEDFTARVWENPRYLITQGDTPEILKPPCRYNALHCAVISGRLRICQKIFEILGGDRFWSLMYPDDSSEVQNRRRSRLIDLYLNSCDGKIISRNGTSRITGAQETPLHFACKLGHEDIVTYLLTFPTLNTRRTNKDGYTAYEITCSKDRSASVNKKQRILDCLTTPAMYIPVLRSFDNTEPPKLSSPCTLQQLESHQSPPLLDMKESPVINSAIAGPMSPIQAKKFYNEWRSPSRKEVKNVKRSDPDRGYERIGRQLAHQQKIPWKEYWGFLDCSCDLSKPSGQEALEKYISTLSLTSRQSLLDESLLLQLSSPEQECHDESLEVLQHNGPMKDISTDIILADMIDSKLSLHTAPKSSRLKGNKDCINKVFLTGSEPTKLDYDVMLALADSDIDKSTYPCITHWLSLIKSYPEEEQRRWHTPRSTVRSNHHTPPPPFTSRTTPTRRPQSRSAHNYRQYPVSTPPRGTGHTPTSRLVDKFTLS